MFVNKIVQSLYQPFPRIDLGEIILREIEDKDVRDYFEYMGREDMAPFLTDDNKTDTIEKAEKELNYWKSLFPNKRSFYWAIATKDNDKLIGTAGFNMISVAHLRTEISYDLNPDFWGKGIMLKSVQNILKFADNNLGLVRAQATVVATNERSIKLLERCGFVKEGYLKKFEIVDGQHRDYYLYARVN
jgi:ribosomal-protein-alanine N-acetyltransferase